MCGFCWPVLWNALSFSLSLRGLPPLWLAHDPGDDNTRGPSLSLSLFPFPSRASSLAYQAQSRTRSEAGVRPSHRARRGLDPPLPPVVGPQARPAHAYVVLCWTPCQARASDGGSTVPYCGAKGDCMSLCLRWRAGRAGEGRTMAEAPCSCCGGGRPCLPKPPFPAPRSPDSPDSRGPARLHALRKWRRGAATTDSRKHGGRAGRMQPHAPTAGRA